MNIFETLGPKLRKAILLVEAGSRLLRRMKSGIVVNEFPSGSGPHNVGAQSQQLAKSIDVFGPENWNRGTLAHEISHIVKPYDPLRKRTGRLRVMLDKLKEQRNSFLTRKKELPRIKERADKAEELLRRVQARSEAKANFYGKQKHLRGREYDWHKDTNGELPPNLAKRQQEYLNAADAPDYHTRSKAYLKLSAVTRAGNLQEALSEQTRAMIPKNKFVAPTMSRVGHEDKGLYPIFDKKSAKSALKLSGKHPHLKQEIARRAAAYGVKPEKKGTRYA